MMTLKKFRLFSTHSQKHTKKKCKLTDIDWLEAWDKGKIKNIPQRLNLISDLIKKQINTIKNILALEQKDSVILAHVLETITKDETKLPDLSSLITQEFQEIETINRQLEEILELLQTQDSELKKIIKSKDSEGKKCAQVSEIKQITNKEHLLILRTISEFNQLMFSINKQKPKFQRFSDIMKIRSKIFRSTNKIIKQIRKRLLQFTGGEHLLRNVITFIRLDCLFVIENYKQTGIDASDDVIKDIKNLKKELSEIDKEEFSRITLAIRKHL